MGMKIILSVCIVQKDLGVRLQRLYRVTFRITSIYPDSLKESESVIRKVNDESKVKEELQNLFDSFSKNDTKNGQTYREVLQEEIRSERQAFDAMKEEIQLARYRNSLNRRNLHKNGDNSEKVLEVVKRQVNQDNTSSTGVKVSTSRVEKRMAVTLTSSEQFYLYVRVNQSRKPVNDFQSETLRMKTDTCASIIRGLPLNGHQELEPVGLQEDHMFEDLKEGHPRVYDHYFQNQTVKTAVTQSANPYILRGIVQHDNTFQEWVFTCMAANRKSMQIVQYFISPEYNIRQSITKKKGEEPLGRFVFENTDSREMILVALAEEPAQKLAHGPDSVEHLFQDEINDDTLKRSHAVCDLTAFQKVRLCSSVVSADDKAQLFVKKDHVEPICVSKEIHFEHFSELHYEDDYNQWWEMADPHPQRMLACTVGQIGNNEPVTLYITRGFNADQFFVSRENVNKTIVLESIISSKVEA